MHVFSPWLLHSCRFCDLEPIALNNWYILMELCERCHNFAIMGCNLDSTPALLQPLAGKGEDLACLQRVAHEAD